MQRDFEVQWVQYKTGEVFIALDAEEKNNKNFMNFVLDIGSEAYRKDGLSWKKVRWAILSFL